MRLSKFVPSPSMAVSMVALTVALSGGAYAAGLVGSNDVRNDSLRSKDIRNGTLKSKDVANKAIKGKDVAKDTLKSWDITDGTVQAKDLRPGTLPQEPRWVLVNAAGQIERQSGGFSVTAGYPALPSPGNGNVYINAGEDLTDNGIVASIVLQNTVDQSTPADGVMNGRAAGADSNPEFSGEIAVSQCGTPITACAPAGTGNVNHFVVSPRLSDGGFTDDTNRKRFYVVITP